MSKKNFGLRNADCGLGRSRRARTSSLSDIPHSAIRNPQSRRPRRHRRGVLLLVVLSLLVLFLMIGTAFIITTKQAEKGAKMMRKAAEKQTAEAARGNLLDDVLLQLVRDTDNPNSVLRSHSLLGDLYGNDGFRGVAQTVGWAGTSLPSGGGDLTRGQMLELSLATDATLTDVFGVSVPNPAAYFSQIDDAYNGLVVTFLTGPARGRSTRIVSYRPALTTAPPAPSAPTFTIMTVPLADGSLITNPADLAGSRIIVNGRPFNGTGAGLDPTLPPATENAKLVAAETDGATPTPTDIGPIALLPNPVFFNPANVRISNAANPGLYFADAFARSDMAGRGGADESYDAADFQNMFLAAVQDELEDNQNPGSGTLENMVLPSFHRPELINYWNKRVTDAGSDPLVVPSNMNSNAVLLRKVLLRPNHIDHPKFTGGNLQYENALRDFYPASATDDFTPNPDPLVQQSMLYSYVYGPWDVDNDNDGNRDSVWIDAGLPVIQGPHGRLVKPLVAMLVVDMDGRININTAGTFDMAARDLPPGAVPGYARVGVATLAENQPSDGTPRGEGWGPAEISARAALGQNSTASLVVGNDPPPGGGGGVTGGFPGRYGRDDAAGRGTGTPTGGAYLDLMSQIQFFGWPLQGRNNPTGRTSFAAPPNLRARYGNGINDYGQQVIEATLTSEVGANGALLADSPYETNFYAEGTETNNGRQANDTPFSLAELERFLRVYDTDSFTLPGRLSGLSGDTEKVHVERNRVTAESWSILGPQVTLPHEMDDPTLHVTDPAKIAANPALARLPQSTAELFEMRVRKALFGNNQFMIFPHPLYDPASSDPVQRDPANRDRVRNVLRQILAPELAAGLKLDVNRPLGNGQDDNGNGVVDEPGEDNMTNQRGVWQNMATMPGVSAEPLAASFQTARFTPLDVPYMAEAPADQGVVNDADAVLQRQLLARHLYVLALTLTAEPGYTGTDAREGRVARRIAQWAMNIVEFRDADNTMTPFEYDVNPFDGWNVNGLIDTRPGSDGVLGTSDDQPIPGVSNQDDSQAVRGLVWGTERPELVINETFAYHDRNTSNEADEDPNPDEEPADASDPLNEVNGERDQLYRPRGAFFLELYNPWPMATGPATDTHAVDASGEDMGIDLSRTHDGVPNSPTGSPVWRLISYRDADPTKDPDDPENLPTEVDRSVYFIGRAPNLPNDGDTFYNDLADAEAAVVPSVRPGRYLVVGSGSEQTTPGEYLSALGQSFGPRNSPDRKPVRGIFLNTQNSPTTPPVRVVDFQGSSDVRAAAAIAMLRDPQIELAPPLQGVPMAPPSEDDARLADANFPQDAVASTRTSVADVAVINGPRRLTLSEPMNGYPRRVGNVEWRWNDGRDGNPPIPASMQEPGEDGFYCYGGDPNRPKAVDTPLDNGDPILSVMGPHFNYRQIYLQRLADPLAPFDAVRNPYRTVDKAPVNLTVFSGRLPNNEDEYTVQNDNQDPNAPVQPGQGTGPNNRGARAAFSSLERGYRGEEQGRDEYNIWTVQPQDRQQTVVQDVARAAATRLDPQDDYALDAIPTCTLGFVNRAHMDEAITQSSLKRIRPDDPFPWLAWNNRPFVSGNELMLVPRLRSSELLKAFAISDNDNDSSYDSVTIYDPTLDPRQVDEDDITAFQHLENPFYDEEPSGANPLNDQPSHLYRVLEFVQTQSLFTGATTWLNPAMFPSPTPPLPGGPPPALPITDVANDLRDRFRPPFNRVSQFREPGRVNLNTIFSPAVYGGLFHGEDEDAGDVEPEGSNNVHAGPEWNDEDSLVRSRRGYGPGGADMLALDPVMPTFFANPFRAPGAGNLVPLPSMVRAGVETTLLRSTSATAGDIDDAPLFAGDYDDDHNDAERNAFFRYSPMTRLNNLTSTQSNVFAVWITVGFFEVEEAPDIGNFATTNGGISGPALNALYNRVYPDGVMLGKEDGLDEGDVRRLRGFYIIDRSRPAGFIPGQDANAETTIRLHRRIE